MNQDNENQTMPENQVSAAKVGKSKYKKIGMIVIYILGAFILLCVLFISFLQVNTFKVKPQNNQTLENYFLKSNVFQGINPDNGKFDLKIPVEVVNQELTKQGLEKDVAIYNLEFDVQEKIAKVNYKFYGFYFPILYELKPIFDTHIEYNLEPKALGKMGIPLSRWFYQRVLGNIHELLPNTIEISSGVIQKYGLENTDWKQEKDFILAKFKLAGDPLDDIVVGLNALSENEVKYIYEEGTEKEKRLTQLIRDYPKSKEQLREELSDSYFSSQPMFKKFLMLMNGELVKKTFKAYPFVKQKYELNTLLKERSDLIAQSIKDYGKEILQVTKEWMINSGGEFYNNGYPYLKKSYRTVSIEDVIKTWNLAISKSISKHIHFGLDQVDNQLAVVYTVDSDSYVVIKTDGYFVVDSQTYQARYHRAMPETGDFTKDSNIWLAITEKLKRSFKTKQIFIRYMKDDGKDAFVLASFLEKPQDIQAITFSKIEGQWQPTASNFKDIQELQGKDSRFNLNLYTDMYENPKLIFIDSDALNNIIEELRYDNKLGEGVSPIYYSYKGKFIYVKLSDGTEYILTTYYQYLDKTYTVEKAKEIYGDKLPQIIMLQSAPVEEAKTETKEAKEASN